MTETPAFLDVVAERDPAFGEHLVNVYEHARRSGELDEKTKTLIALAIDAGSGHEEGVENLAEKARRQGASEGEILETLEVVTLISGTQGLVTGLGAIDDDVEPTK